MALTPLEIYSNIVTNGKMGDGIAMSEDAIAAGIDAELEKIAVGLDEKTLCVMAEDIRARKRGRDG